MPSDPPDGRRTLVDLTGEWQAQMVTGPDDHQRDWSALPVPGRWQADPAFADWAGPVRYRSEFTVDPPATGRRRWIDVDGVMYQADVWLDEAYLGDPEGYFAPAAFDITEPTGDGAPHRVEFEVTCPPVQADTPRATVTGWYQGFIDHRHVPGGLPGAVSVTETGPVRIDRLRVLCRDADPSRAHLLVTARLDSASERPVRIRTLVDTAVVTEFEHTVATGGNEVSWTLDIIEPRLWWPHALGEQHLVDIGVEVITEGACSDRLTRRTGLREVAWDRWICSVNGERLFLKGAGVVPIRPDPAAIGTADIERLIEGVTTAGLDAIRVQGHVAPDHLYDTADRLGVLVLQDFPLTGAHARRVRPAAVRQAVAAVDRLGHHPSLVLWWAHEDMRRDPPPSASRPGLVRRLVAHQRPSWNRTVLDRWVKRAIEHADPTRPVVAQSGSLPHLPTLDGADSHLWFGWTDGALDELPRTARRLPRLFRFVSEFGSQSVPASADFIETDRWPDLDWAHLAERHGAELDELLRRFDPAGYRTFAEWQRATQDHQARVVRFTVETLRRLKYRPTGGFCAFALNDPGPAISYSLIDHTGTPLPAAVALGEACRPLLAVADLPAAALTGGMRHRVSLHVVNDLRDRIEAVVGAEAHHRVDGSDGTGRSLGRWRFGGAVDADDCARVGRIEFELPAGPGRFTLELRLEVEGSAPVVNRYHLDVT